VGLPTGYSGYIPPIYINRQDYFPRGFEAEVCIDNMPFLLPNQQHKSREAKYNKIIVHEICLLDVYVYLNQKLCQISFVVT